MDKDTTLTFRLMGPVAGMPTDSGIAPAEWLARHGAASTDSGIVAFIAATDDPSAPRGYALRYRDHDCSVELPAGRYVQFEQEGGHIRSAALTLPLETLDFAAAMSLAAGIGTLLDTAGWDRKIYRADRITEAGFGEFSVGGRFEQFGRWAVCSDPDLEVYVTIKDFNSLPTAPMAPLTLVPGDADDEVARYVLEVFFQPARLEVGDELVRLRDARRAETGRSGEALPLEVWLDDPAWRPAGWRGERLD